MEFLSFKFAGFILLSLLVFHFFSGIQTKRFIFLGLNLSFIFFLAPLGSNLFHFLIFLAIGFVFITIVQMRKDVMTLFILILLMVFLFMYFKSYSILYFIPKTQAFYFVTGLSYILFRILHLLIDIHSGALKEKISALDYFNYTCFFLSIISGPIQQYENYKTQEKKSLNFVADQNNIFEDFSRIANGLIKIGFIAAFFHFFFGEFSGRIENNKFPIEITYICAALLYTQFLYFNFSGYMDVVIGIGKLFGFQLPENFNKPFQSINFLDFWSRWHITLAGWFKVYLFNPLLKLLTYQWPSAKVSPYLGVISFFVTFFVMGVWHGSTKTFLVYGLFLGFGVSLNKLFQVNMSRWYGKNKYQLLKEKKFYRLICSAMTYSYISLGLTCLWMNDEQLFLTINVLGLSGLLLCSMMAILVSSCVLWFSPWLRIVWLIVSERRGALFNNHWCREIYLACKFFLIIFVIIEGNIPGFVYKWF